MEQNVYIKTRNLVELSEISLSNSKYIFSSRKEKIFSFEFDVRLPIGYMLIGFKDFFLPFKKAVILLSILLLSIVIGHYFISNINLIVQFQFLITILMIIVFALPSRYAYYSTNNESINKVVKILYSLKINSNNELELIEKNIESIYLRVQNRIQALRWVINVFWIVYVFLTKKIESLFEILKIEEKIDITNIYNYIGDNFLIIMYFLIPIIIISVYKRGMDFLFKSILFSINNLKLNTQDKTVNPLQKTFLKLHINKK